MASFVPTLARIVTNSGNLHRLRRLFLTDFLTDGKMRTVDGPTRVRTRRRLANSPALAEVAELADALHSGCSARQGVEVRVLSSAPFLSFWLALVGGLNSGDAQPYSCAILLRRA